MSYATDFFQTGDVENACSDWQKIDYNKSAVLPQGGQRDGQRPEHGEI